MPESFHFLQPQWFYLLLPTVIVIWLLRRQDFAANDAWQKIIDKNLLSWLRVSKTGSHDRLPLLWLLGIGWCVTIVALANPVWEKLPQPAFQTDLARVIVLDLSRSMNSTDLKPSRIERARFKISDMLRLQQEGVIGLVVFAGDAFAVSPLTRDVDTISAMLPALEPAIMPVQGSRVDLALLKAAELLQQAGRLRGEILLLADSYTDERTIETAEKLRQQGFIISVLGMGTEQGAPLPTGQGGFFRNNKGDVITTRLDRSAMQKLASAGGGNYLSLSTSDADITSLMEARTKGVRSLSENESFETTRWKETGPWLVILLLPLAALAFRRGWLLSACLFVFTAMPNQPALAFSMTDLWQRQDQQAHKALLAGDAERASALAKDPLRKGVADFRNGDYAAAVEDFSKSDSAKAAYNKGNALAKLGKLEEAIDAYDQALKDQPVMEDAEYNRAAVEKLLQQKQQEQNKDQQGKDQENQQGKQGDKDQQDGQQNNKQQGEQDESQQQGKSGQQGDDADSKEGGQDQQQADDNAFSDAAEQVKNDAEEKEAKEGDEAEQAEQMTAGKQQENDKEQGAEKAQQPSSQAEESQQGQDDDQKQKAAAVAEAEELSTEEQIAAEQWLRRIPDDPAGLLRRKLRYQYIQRGGDSGKAGDPQPW